jgi:hypothetical protein
MQKGSQPAGVIVLEHSAKLQRVEFRAVRPRMYQPKLKGLWVTDCEGLEQADLSGLAALQQLRIEGCERLQEVLGLRCLSQLEVLELSGCSKQVVRPSGQPPRVLSAVPQAACVVVSAPQPSCGSCCLEGTLQHMVSRSTAAADVCTHPAISHAVGCASSSHA